MIGDKLIEKLKEVTKAVYNASNLEEYEKAEYQKMVLIYKIKKLKSRDEDLKRMRYNCYYD